MCDKNINAFDHHVLKLNMIQIENTPNPNALKFISDKKMSEVGTKEYQKNKIDEAPNDFIKSLLSINGIELILIAENFLSVKKEINADWENIKPTVISSLNDYFYSNQKPILTRQKSEKTKLKKDNSSDVVKQINEVLETKIRPAVSRDGGDIKFISFENGVVKVELRGSCSGCPSSTMTLKKGVQNLLKHYVHGVESVEAI